MDKRPPISIRLAVLADAPAIAVLAGELGYPTSILAMSLRLAALLEHRGDAVFVAEQSTVVGWLHISAVRSLESEAFAEIRGLVVAGNRRGSGIGSALVNAAEQWAMGQGFQKIRVRSNSVRSKAKLFYEKLSYAVVKNQNVFDKPL